MWGALYMLLSGVISVWVELCLPKEVGKGAGELSCLQGGAVALFPCSGIQKGIRHGLCFLVCTSLGFLSFCGEFLLEMWV